VPSRKVDQKMKQFLLLTVVASIVLAGCGDGGTTTTTNTAGTAAPAPVKDAKSGNEMSGPAAPSAN
jgi:hypothetical protein